MPVAASIFIHFFCISFLGIGGFIVTLPDIYRWIVAADGLMTQFERQPYRSIHAGAEPHRHVVPMFEIGCDIGKSHVVEHYPAACPAAVIGYIHIPHRETACAEKSGRCESGSKDC